MKALIKALKIRTYNMLYRFQPKDIDDETLVELIEEYWNLVNSMGAMLAQDPEWWEDDLTGKKEAVFNDMKEHQGEMLEQFPFLMHVPAMKLSQLQRKH